MYFNPRTREGCDCLRGLLGTQVLDFNPRTREGCDTVTDVEGHGSCISIHAPAKGATITKPTRQEEIEIFQSTHPRRVRHVKELKILITKGISIHAPAKGATVHVEPLQFGLSNFNPRTREGCDKSTEFSVNTLHISIHAPAKGATISLLSFLRGLLDFNPRTREGCDATIQIVIQ
mgnify:CR=1 FL=1